MVLFLRARRTSATAAWWAAAAKARAVPEIVGELLRGDVSVVHDPPEGDLAIAWARTLPEWNEAEPALWLEDPWETRGRRRHLPQALNLNPPV